MVKKKKKIKLKNIAMLVGVTTMIATFITLSRYKSTFASPDSHANIGKPVISVDSNKSMTLEKMKPGDIKEYTFSVKNQEEEIATDVAIGYTIQIETGNYLPLKIELYSIDNGIVNVNNLLNNSNTTEEQELSLLTESHDYKLVVTWQESEKNYKYSEEIDYIKILVDSYQKNGEE